MPSQKKTETLQIFHLDLNFVNLRQDYIRAWLPRLKAMGYNAILWELEDKVRWETCPECVWPEAMTKAEFRDLLAYSRRLGLEPIPLLQTVGHAEYVLKHKKYQAMRELPDRHDCYCTSSRRVRNFLRRWIEEYLDLFGKLRHFHLGGDEAYVFASCPKCAARAAAAGRNRLFGEHIMDLAAPLLDRHIRPGIWNDMVMKDPELLGFDPERFVFWDWNYHDGEEAPQSVNLRELGRHTAESIAASGLLKKYPDLLDRQGRLRPFPASRILRRHGFEVILSSASRSAGDTFFHPLPRHAANIVGAAKTVAAAGLLGHCVTSWAIRLNDYTTQLPFLGLAATAGRSKRNTDELLADWCRKHFGTAPDKFIRAVSLLGITVPFAASKTTGVQWNGLKDSTQPPAGYLRRHLAKVAKESPAAFANFRPQLRKVIAGTPEAIRLLAEFYLEAPRGHEVIDAWLTGARFLLASALAGDMILGGAAGNPEAAAVLAHTRDEYAAFLSRRETPLSAAKNAALVYDTLVEALKNRRGGDFC